MSIADGSLTSLAFRWRLERSDGAGMGLTSCDRDIVDGDAIYRASPGVTPAAVSRSLGLEPDLGEVAGALSADALTESDLALGRWNGAKVALDAVDWSIPGTENIPLITGELGEISLQGEEFSAELRGAAARLSKAACPHTSAECRASFGDKKCRVDLSGRTVRATVDSGGGNSLQLAVPVDDRFLFGRLRLLRGPGCGFSTVILAIDGARVALRDRLRAPVAAGAVVEIREGCDKRFETCAGRFHNAANFRGEPHLPGTDLLTRYPGA